MNPVKIDLIENKINEAKRFNTLCGLGSGERCVDCRYDACSEWEHYNEGDEE